MASVSWKSLKKKRISSRAWVVVGSSVGVLRGVVVTSFSSRGDSFGGNGRRCAPLDISCSTFALSPMV